VSTTQQVNISQPKLRSEKFEDNNNNNNNNNKEEDDDDNNNYINKVTILLNQQIQTDRTSPNNKPDIIILHNEKGTCMIIEVAISGDRNVIKKE